MTVIKKSKLNLTRLTLVASAAGLIGIPIWGALSGFDSAPSSETGTHQVAMAPWPLEHPNPLCRGPFC